MPPLLAPAREGADREVRAGNEAANEGRLAGPRGPDQGGDLAAQDRGERFQPGTGEGARLEHGIADAAIGVEVRATRALAAQVDLVQHEGGGEVEMLASNEVAVDGSA